ncbi:MAG TPA: choice-of-anchor I family protein [Methylomirabilota bacterium]|nr:choice-of-anchor I family protein [Methylomirabilota bacterium]
MRTIPLTLTLTGLMAAATAASANPPHSITLTPIGTYASGVFDQGAAEIVAHDPKTQRLFVVNANDATVDVLNITDPTDPTKIGTIDVTAFGTVANSVAIHGTLVAVAVQNEEKTEPGRVVFFDTDLNFLASVEVGAQPDMLAFTPNGRHVVVANEGEPNDDYTIDPEGSVSIIDLRRARGGRELPLSVRTATCTRFNDVVLDPSIRIFGPGATVAQDLEPEYITLSDDSRTAWVTCQEANAIAIIDIRSAEVLDLVGLGFKDHSLPGNGLDASDRDGAINIANWPVLGMYLPDAIASYRVGAHTFLVTANEGDTRDYDGFSEEARMGSLPLDPVIFPDAAVLQEDANLGRLLTSTVMGLNPVTGYYEELYSVGARSFSIWTATGRQVYDSGDEFEMITAAMFPDGFNASNTNNNFDNRSDDKGPEPEGVVIGRLYGRTYAFIGLERVGGVMVYDITNPFAAFFVDYVNLRDFATDVESPEAGDLGPEGLVFIEAKDSPNGKPLLVTGNEVSGTTTVFEINRIVGR